MRLALIPLLGALMAYVGVDALLALEPGRLPRVAEVGVDATALLFALGVSLVAAVGIGVVVVLRAHARGHFCAISFRFRTLEIGRHTNCFQILMASLHNPTLTYDNE